MNAKWSVAPLLAIFLSCAWAEPIRLHPKNPHYFLFRGKAVALITSGEHYGAVLNPDFDCRRYLDALAADGLNYTRIFGGSYLEVPAKSFGILRNTLAPQAGRYLAPWARSATPGYAGGGNKFDLERWDPEFFARYRDFLAEAGKRGIVVEVTLFSSHYDDKQWQVSALNPGNNVNTTTPIDWKRLHTIDNGNLLAYQERYTRKLVREANAFDNVFFEIQNEPWSDRAEISGVVNPYLRPPSRDTYPNSIDLADELSLLWQSRVTQWITIEEATMPNRHLIAQNYANFLFPVRALINGVSIVNFHYAYPEAALLNYGLNKVISYDESGFIGREDNTYLRQAWNFMLSGGGVFNNLDYSFTAEHPDGTDTEPNGPGGGSPTLRRQLKILAEFVSRFSLPDLRPDFLTVKRVAGAYGHMMSNPGKEYALYIDGAGPIEVTFDLPAGNYSGEWVNVQTGAVQREEKLQHLGGEVVLRTPEFMHGIALRLTKVLQHAK